MSGDGKQTYLVLKRTNTSINGQLYIGGAPQVLPKDAKLTVQLADTSLQDAPAKVAAQVTIDDLETKRNGGNWLSFEFDVVWKDVEAGLQLNDMRLQARIEAADGKLLYCTKVSYPVNVGKGVLFVPPQTVVAEPV